MRILVLFLSAAALVEAQGPEIDFFERRIRPVLVEHCEACHSSRLAEPMGGLRVDSRDGLLRGGASGPALVLGDPERSLMIKALRYLEPCPQDAADGKAPGPCDRGFQGLDCQRGHGSPQRTPCGSLGVLE